jgi:Na+-driven multidrug efflux pump
VAHGAHFLILYNPGVPISLSYITPVWRLQSGLLAQKNSVRPGLSVVVAAVVNTVLDVVLMSQFGMGVVGAAVATVIGQIIMFLMLLPPYIHRASRVLPLLVHDA